nr:hypothetical protein 495p1_00125 [Serratia proteamaculans]
MGIAAGSKNCGKCGNKIVKHPAGFLHRITALNKLASYAGAIGPSPY